jgi:hypothetical protein
LFWAQTRFWRVFLFNKSRKTTHHFHRLLTAIRLLVSFSDQ